MPRVVPFTVVAQLPETLQPLRSLSSNLWWTWNSRAKSLFYRVNTDTYVRLNQNPIATLNALSRTEIDALKQNAPFVGDLNEVSSLFEEYLGAHNWWANNKQRFPNFRVAYFSAEFGLHESFQIYSGGLGVLAGDFLKAASDLGVPAVGVGLLYYEGYFHQYLNADGWQQETNPQLELVNLPLRPVFLPDGNRLQVSVPIDGHTVSVQAWEVDVGRTKLYLLDTNCEGNSAADRQITARLYGGDIHTRIKQELVLGVGGFRMLRELGAHPDLCHMNEGHSAFLALEQIRELVREKGLSFDEALVGARAANLFTTHTPVPAGNEVFPKEVVTQYLSSLTAEIGIDIERLLQLGRVQPRDTSEPFSMTVFALRLSGAANGVSELHGRVSRKLWHKLWPDLPADDVPIGHVTNGVHTATWASRDIAELFDRYLGTRWREEAYDPEAWKRVSEIPDEELWRILSRRRSLLVTFCRERLKAQLIRRGAGRVEIENASRVLDPDILTIGFARRFAAYKRATLVLRDVERLIRLISHHEHPVQFVFSGKAHPADHAGKALIAEIIHSVRRSELRNRVVFLEDYDIGVARTLYQGADVWLNNPRRPLEASGTSGMKAAVNGTLNLSVLDGWWCEAFDNDRHNGFCIGLGEEYPDPNYQDDVESRGLYDLLEREIIPSFYDRPYGDIPRAWIAQVKQSIQTIAPKFSASRMVLEYVNSFYAPLLVSSTEVQKESWGVARRVAARENFFREKWGGVKIVSVNTGSQKPLAIGESLTLKVSVDVGELKPTDVAVQVCYGPVDMTSVIHDRSVVSLDTVQPLPETGRYSYSGEVSSERAGSYGLSVRVVPVIEGRAIATLPGLIVWWS